MDESNVRMPLPGTTVPPAEPARIDRPLAPSLNAPVCPYCGLRTEPGAERCGSCKGLLDPLSRQATQNAMGPWALRDDAATCTPGFSYETLRSMVQRGRIRRDSIVRGPTTRQFWMFAANTPGVAVLLGECHACHRSVRPDEFLCVECGASLNPQTDRQTLGLAPVRLLPGAASAPAVAASAVRSAAALGPPEPADRPEVLETPPALRRPVLEAPRETAPVSEGFEPIAPARASVSLRRMRSRVHVLTVALVLAVCAMAALLVVLVSMAVHEEPASPVANNGPSPRATPPTSPTPGAASPIAPAPVEPDPTSAPVDPEPTPDPIATVSDVPVDAGLERWHADIEEAIALERADSLESLDRAIAILQRVFDEASGARTGGGASLPILRERLTVLRERAASWRARHQ